MSFDKAISLLLNRYKESSDPDEKTQLYDGASVLEAAAKVDKEDKAGVADETGTGFTRGPRSGNTGEGATPSPGSLSEEDERAAKRLEMCLGNLHSRLKEEFRGVHVGPSVIADLENDRKALAHLRSRLEKTK